MSLKHASKTTRKPNDFNGLSNKVDKLAEIAIVITLSKQGSKTLKETYTMPTYTGQLKAVIAKYKEAGTLFEGPFVLYKRPKVGDLDVRPFTPDMAADIEKTGTPVFAVFPKKGSGHMDIAGLDAYIRAVCSEPKYGLIDEEGEHRIKCHRAANLIASERGVLCVRINNWSAHHPDKMLDGAVPPDIAPKDIFLAYSNIDTGSGNKKKTQTTYL